MAIAHEQEMIDLARQCYVAARDAADKIQLLESERTLYKKAASAQMISTLPRYADIAPFYGVRARAAMLFVDIRRSSARAVAIGPRRTYLTMHTFIPVMTELVGRANGVTVGLRGDGIFAAFGLEEILARPADDDKLAAAVKAASECGQAMIESVDRVLNPLLASHEVNGNAGPLRIGVGIDAGEIVVTRIGRHSAQELTAYGSAVNEAAHLSDGQQNKVAMSGRAYELFPRHPDGCLHFEPGDGDCFIADYSRVPPMLSAE